MIGISPATLMNWRCRKLGPPFVKLGRKIWYKTESLNAWINSKEQHADGFTEPKREMALQVLRSRPNVDRRLRLGGHRTQSERRADGRGRGAQAGEGRSRRPSEADHKPFRDAANQFIEWSKGEYRSKPNTWRGCGEAWRA